MHVPDDIFNELLDTGEVLERFFLFLEKRIPESGFQLVSGSERIISSEPLPDFSSRDRNRLIAMAKGQGGFVHIRCEGALVAHAINIEGLDAVLIALHAGGGAGADTGMRYDDADLVLSLIELFFSKEDLDDLREDLKTQKKQLKRENHILQQRYYKILEENYRQQREYAQTLKDELGRKTREILTANELLQHEIEERKHMVVTANELALKAKMASRSKSEFLSRMSHELRTPLNSIIGFSDLMGETKPSDEQREYIGIITESSHSLLDLINDILDLSKIEAGKVVVENLEFNLMETVRQVESITNFMRLEKGIRLEKAIDPGLDCNIVGDPTSLHQVLVNLMGNAIKFMENGNITLRLDVVQKSDSHMEIRFSVEDEGIGIPEDKMETIFSPFGQADGSTTRKFGGTGLGLCISQELVKLMGGEGISLTTEVGVGSNFFFSIRFPRGSELEEAAEETLPAVNNAVLRPLRILLVEDIPQNRKLVTTVLTKQGHSVCVAENGKEAVDSVQAEAFDVVLMDVEMPVMDGMEATGIIRDKNMDIPIIAMTANAMKSDREKCLAAGMDAFISKPINVRDLKGKIQSVIERKRCPEHAPKFLANRSGEAIKPESPAPSSELDIAEALERLDNDKALLRDTLVDFSAGNDGIICQMREALDNGEMATARRLAHGLKGTAGAISANALRDAAVALEAAIVQNAQDRLDNKVDNVEIALNRALASVRSAIPLLGEEKALAEKRHGVGGALPGDAIASGNSKGVSPLLCELDGALEKCDAIRSEEILEALKKQFRESRFYEALLLIEEEMEDFEFEAGRQKLVSLAAALKSSDDPEAKG